MLKSDDALFTEMQDLFGRLSQMDGFNDYDKSRILNKMFNEGSYSLSKDPKMRSITNSSKPGA